MLSGSRATATLKTSFSLNVLSVAAAIAVVLGLSRAMTILSKDEDPILVYAELTGEFFDDYANVLSVAHNSGNRLTTSRESLQYKADVIEIDVRMVRGQLRAAHNAPVALVGAYASRAPTLSLLWPTASGARMVNLDIKENTDALLSRLFAFLRSHEDPNTHIIITSRSVRTLERAREAYPRALRFLSVASELRMQSALDDPKLLSVIDGVSVANSALTEDAAGRLEAEALLTYVWVVNDLPTLNRLVRWGVDGMITDNLAIMELLGTHPDDD